MSEVDEVPEEGVVFASVLGIFVNSEKVTFPNTEYVVPLESSFFWVKLLSELYPFPL
mgnify:CR=1 FL=1